MTGLLRQFLRSRRPAIPVCLAVGLAAAGLAGIASAQDASPKPETSQLNAQPAAAPPAPARNPGFLEVFGRWVDESVAGVGKGLSSAWKPKGEAAPQADKPNGDVATAVVKGAADAANAVGRLPSTRLVSGREICASAPNGAPDCRSAAEALCRANGFNSGSSVDYVTAEKCPAPVLLAGRTPAVGECPLEHVVTRALCQ